jgi:hypothetical protein
VTNFVIPHLSPLNRWHHISIVGKNHTPYE